MPSLRKAHIYQPPSHHVGIGPALGQRSIMNRQRIRKLLLVVAVLLFQVKILHLFMSPVVPVFAARLGIIPGSLLVYAALFVSSLFLGRAFCGWFCPGAGMQELLALVIHRRAGHGWGDRVKYAICGAWSLLILSILFQAGGLPRVDVSFGARSSGIVQEILMRTGHFVIIGVLGAIFGAWASCRYICWIAPFLVLGRRIREFVRLPGLCVVSKPESCSGCEGCRVVCPMSVNVIPEAEMSIRSDDCILCGNCVDVCPAQALRFTFSRD